jgi:hypothetical protein
MHSALVNHFNINFQTQQQVALHLNNENVQMCLQNLKKGSKDHSCTYRPVSLMSHVHKILESIIRDYTMAHDVISSQLNVMMQMITSTHRNDFVNKVNNVSCYFNNLGSYVYYNLFQSYGMNINGCDYDSYPHQQMVIFVMLGGKRFIGSGHCHSLFTVMYCLLYLTTCP